MKHSDTEMTEVGDESELTAVQQRVLASLLLGKSYSEAAKDAGINERTIRRWRQTSPEFEHALRSRIQSVRDDCAIQAAASLAIALKSLMEIVKTPNHPQAIRAIQMVLDLNGPLPPVRDSTGTDQIRADQEFAVLQRFEPRLH